MHDGPHQKRRTLLIELCLVYFPVSGTISDAIARDDDESLLGPGHDAYPLPTQHLLDERDRSPGTPVEKNKVPYLEVTAVGIALGEIKNVSARVRGAEDGVADAAVTVQG